MPLRGPGAARQREAAEALPKRPRRLPWRKAGLSRAEQVIRFCEWLPVTKGRLRGKRMKLLPSQRAFIANAFATDRRGKPTVSLAVLSEPKGNGKTGLCAAIALAYLVGPLAEERGAIYAASIDKGKAGILFEEVKAIVLRVAEFAAVTESAEFKAIEGKLTGSVNASFAVKANELTSATTDDNGSVGDALVPQRLPGIVMPAGR